MAALPPAPPALQSLYRLGTVDPVITLATGRATVMGQGTSVQLDKSKLALRLASSNELRLTGACASSNPALLDLSMSQWAAEEVSFGKRIKGSLVDIGSHLGGDFSALPYQVTFQATAREVRAQPVQQLERVQFHLVNFPAFLGSWISGGSGRWRGRLTLVAGGWQLEIDSRRDLGGVQDKLRERGRFAVSHVGSLHRGGALYSSDEAEDFLTSLHWFFSFVRGSWCSPVIFDGYKGARRAWRKYQAGRIDPMRGDFQWCDLMGWQAAQEALAGYVARWVDPVWQQALRVGIGLYVTANRTDPVEVSIIAAQSGLELLGWVHFVENGSIQPSEWRRSIKAEDKIRKLLRKAKIKLAIPPSLKSLHKLDPNWKDGPAVVAGVRNSLAHPLHTSGRVGWPGDVLVDAWLLSSRYLELALLHALDVTHPIRDRLGWSQWVGSTAKPPWAL